MRIGIVGHPQSGKTTLFNVLAHAHAPTGVASAAGGIHVGTIQVPDPRLEALRDLQKPKKYTPARIEYVDLAGSPSGREASGSLLPQQITTADLLLVVIRAFENPAVPHSRGTVDPRRDLVEFLDELVLKDLAVLEGRIAKIRKAAQVGVKEAKGELPLLERCMATLEEGNPLRDLDFTEDEGKRLRGYGLLTAKPLLIVFNVAEGDVRGAGLKDSLPDATRVAALEICGKVEMDLVELPEDEAEEFMELLGIEESGLARVIHTSYDLLGVMSFFTVGNEEVRAWTVPAGTRALEAAGKVHSDLARGFIRAEVLTAAELLGADGWPGAKTNNVIRVEGKEYIVQDGDVINIRFSV